MAAAGLGLNVNTFYPIFNSLTRKNSLEDAWRVVDQMRRVGVSPDVTVYNHFLATLCFSPDLPATTEVLTKMAEEEMKRDTRTYDALVLGACRAGKDEWMDTEKFVWLASKFINHKTIGQGDALVEGNGRKEAGNGSEIEELLRPLFDCFYRLNQLSHSINFRNQDAVEKVVIS